MPHLITNVIGRRTLVAWWCHCGQRNEGNERYCQKCTHDKIERHAQIHTQDRAVVYINPQTGERRTPPRADQPMPESYAAQGFERHEIMSMTKFERDTGLVHEATAYRAGNEPLPDEPHPAPHAPKEVIQGIIDDLRAAHQSGPWTMDQPLNDGPREE